MKFFKLQQVSPNDDELKIVQVIVENSQYIEEGELIFEVEGQKATFEIYAEASGYFYTSFIKGVSIDVSQDAYAISSELLPPDVLAETLKKNITKKEKKEGGQGSFAIEMVSSSDENFKEYEFQQKITPPRSGKFRLIIIGAGRAFRQMEDALFNNPHFEIHEVMDDSGIGSISRQLLDFNALHADYRAGIYDAAFVATGNNGRRAKLISELRARGIKMCNILHPSSVIANDVLLGENIFIGANVTIGANVKLNSGVFISAQSNIEHHCNIGDFVLIGPGVALSGSVTIGRNSIISAGVAVEPDIRIGQNVFIPLNHPIFDDVEDSYKFAYKKRNK